VRGRDRALEFIECVKAAHTPEGVCRSLLSLTSGFGLTALVAGTLPDARPAAGNGTGNRNRVVLCNWPLARSSTFVAADLRHDDPLMAEIGALQARFHGPRRAAPGAAASGAAVSDLNVRDVVAFSLIAPDGSLIGALLGGDKGYSASELRLILLVSTYAVGRAIQMLDSRPAPCIGEVRLTSREIECLQWASRGKSEWEIGIILGISEHTSEKHLISARVKLGAANRVEAVAEAIRRGYI
jgi:LuxR family quorum sensing-dependent transcriptional regulator